ncbi:MAG: ASCH domain-containing protein [Candidatus Altiarchaeales archaeon]|nr:MAG: ASCH domain-containing protein [Candidatus Altiarchaeales archaeon]RLI94822.1 MAG: ASCH domain-containing protein [Candidatus Altiarchaeales archaeon]HDO82098.1 ASCH domain-containing protein [Candidatus Altiarchaeales archaeon]HEX54747.1 ASCH domain-containing protein [Candidatus Altiarchaeales archaeon]
MVKRKRLNFRKRYKDKILSGMKKATIRLGRVKKYGIGDVVDIYAGDEKISSAVISKIRYLKFKELTREDVMKDGFKSKSELKRALKKIYKKEFKSDSDLTQIEFILLSVF